MINQQIQHYRITSELGKGGMATVYLAHDLKFDTKVAIKILNKEFIHNDNIRKRFITEARNIYRMTHPNMVRVTDLIEEGDVVAFVMEYIDGETLKEYLESRGKLKDDELKDIFSQMLEALNYVHEQQLVHRDIKPSNFMLDKTGKIKLLDFGIAKTLDANALEYTQTTTGMQMGTPMYMSPEQIIETKSVTAQSDIYSLGVVLWQMTMGEKPYDSQTISNFQLQTKIVNEPLPLTNTNWDSCIQKATHKEPSHRYKSCNTWQREIGNLMGGNNSQSEKTKIETDSASAYRNVSASSNSENPKYTANSKKEKQERKGYFNLKTLSIGIGILLFIGIIVVCFVYLGFKDRDSDGTADKNDSCPEIRGLNKFNGCPDSDNDGIPNNQDNCPDVFGNEIDGCPKDRDNDGIPDNDDRCPEVFGDDLDGCLRIGQEYQGGIIFYIDKSGEHGKVCAPIGTIPEGYEWDSAIEVCQNFYLDGYSDWYLPTIDDLNNCYDQLEALKSGAGGFQNGFYWSSTEYTNKGAWYKNFTNGINGEGAKYGNYLYIRPIRDF